MPRDDPGPRATPPRNATGGMALVLAGGIGLWWLCSAYPAALPAIAPWQFSWVFYLGTVCALWWFARGLRIISVSPWRRRAFTGGVILIYAMLQTHADYWAQHMFFLSQTQHFVLQSVAPFLIAIAAPGATLRAGMPETLRRLPGGAALRRTIRLLRHPVLAPTLFIAIFAVWLLPAMQFRAMLDPSLYEVMNASMVGSGLLFWCFLLDARPVPLASAGLVTRIVIGLLIGLPMIAIGTTISNQLGDIYANFALCGRLISGIDAVTDQQIGALILWMPPGLLTGTAVMVLIRRMFEEDDRVMLERLAEARR